MLDPNTWSREEIERHSVDVRQFIDFRQSTLANGLRIIEAYNSSGLSFTILPDRGLDIWTAHYKGIPLTWVAQNSPFPPDHGQKWLRQFNGGLLATCGLLHVGQPVTDDETGEYRDLHGRINRLRASDPAVQGRWTDETYTLTLDSTVTQSELFGEQLRLERTFTLELGKPVIAIRDLVTNVGDVPSPLMILYHFNMGYPLIWQDTYLNTAFNEVYGYNDHSKTGLDKWYDYEAPSAGYSEQVFFHHVKADKFGYTMALLARDEIGLAFEWDTTTLPYLTQWKNTRQNIYVSGVEPGNCIPEGINNARKSGRLEMLEPGETRIFNLRLMLIDSAVAVEEYNQRVDILQASGDPVAGTNLSDFAAK